VQKCPIQHTHKTNVCQQIHLLPFLSKDQCPLRNIATHIFHDKGYEEAGKSNLIIVQFRTSQNTGINAINYIELSTTKQFDTVQSRSHGRLVG
jgi:hypothetical protein